MHAYMYVIYLRTYVRMYVCVRLYVYFISKASEQISIKFGTGNIH
jgi:hypothetical protein